MPSYALVVFFAVFLSVYGGAHAYVLWRARDGLPRSRGARRALYGLTVVMALAFLGGRLVERFTICAASKALVWAGSTWMAVVAYAFMAAAASDLVRLAHRIRPFLPRSLSRRRVVHAVAGVVVLVVAGGFANAAFVRTRTFDVPIAKRAGPLRELKVVVASDIHLGTVVGKRRFGRIVEAINAERPDLVLLAGDIIDEDLKPVLDEDVGEHLLDLKATYGVFGITGNHEFIGGVGAAVAYLEAHGVRMLRDSAFEVAGAVTIVGREDSSSHRFGAPVRKPLGEVLGRVDRSRPVILLDHQPRDFAPAVEAGVDLQISGHTHHGQLWPFSLITRALYELSWGLERRGATAFYVSCGVGTWGPPVRVGNAPEVVLLRLQFAQ